MSFVNDIRREVATIDNAITIIERTIMKNNGNKDVLEISHPDYEAVHPVIYVDEIKDKDVFEVAVLIADAFNHVPDNASNLINESFNNKEKYTAQVVNVATNEELLEKVAHIKVGDLAIVSRYMVNDDCSFIITKDIAKGTEFNPLEVALENTCNEEYEVCDLGEMLFGIKSETPTQIVVTNVNKNYGAVGIFVREDLRKQVRDMFGRDYYILPSSIHETLCISKTGADEEALKDMVRSINADKNTIKTEDVLSNNIYYVDSNLKITVID